MKRHSLRTLIFFAALPFFTWHVSQRSLANPTTVTASNDVIRKLFLAVKRHDLAHVAALLKAGADPNYEGPNTDWHPVLVYAAQSGDCSLAQLLIRYGAKVNHLSGELPEDQFALLQAARAGKKDMVRLLIRSGADVNLRNNNGRTALMEAANPEITKILLDRGADANASTEWENGYTTALMRAAARADVVTVKMLLAHGASVNPVDRSGYTALGYALEKHHLKVVRLLRRAGAKKSHGAVYI